MATAGSIVVDLLMRTGSFETDAQRAAKTADKRFKEIQKSANDAGRGIGDAFKGALGGAIFGVGVAQVFGKFVEETKNAQNEQAQLKAALASTGEAAGYSADQLNRMATEMAGKSIFGDGDINSAQTRLLSYTGVVGDQFPRALQAAIDMSARLGTSLEQSSETIGKALDVPSQGLTALSKQGFRFTDDQKKLVESLEKTGKTAEAQGIILQALETAYGGAAQAARNTFGGALTALQEQINSLMTGDDDSVNGLTGAINDLTDLLGSGETKAAFASLIGLMVDVSTQIVTLIGDFTRAADTAGGFISAIGAFSAGGNLLGAFRDDASNIQSATDELGKLAEMQDRLNSGAAKWNDFSQESLDSEKKAAQARLGYYKSQLDRSQQASDTTSTAWAGAIPTMPMIPVIGSPSKSGGSEKKGKKEKDEGAALLAQLEKRIALTGDLTERQKLLIDIEQGYTKFKKQEDRDLALGYADTLDFIKEQEEAYRSAQDTLKERSKVSQDTASEMDQFAIQAARNIQDSLGDGLYDILTGNFDDIGSSFANMIMRMATDAAAANLAKALFGDFGSSNQIGGIVGSLGKSIGMSMFGGGAISAGAGASANIGGSAVGSFSGMSYFADGGYTGQGGKYDPAGIVHAGEYVINADATRKLGRSYLDRLNGYSDGGLVGAAPPGVGGGGVKVELTNKSGQQLQAGQGSARFDGREYVVSVVLEDLQRNGPISKRMQGRGM